MRDVIIASSMSWIAMVTARPIAASVAFPGADTKAGRISRWPDPLAELERLERVSREFFVHFARFLPSTRDPVGITDRAIIEDEVARAVAAEDWQ